MTGDAPVSVRLVPCVECAFLARFDEAGNPVEPLAAGWTLVPASTPGEMPLATPHKASCPALPSAAVLAQNAAERASIAEWMARGG